MGVVRGIKKQLVIFILLVISEDSWVSDWFYGF